MPGALLLGAFALPASAAVQVDIKSYGARCNGSDDSGAVQAAINAIPSSGGTVVVSCQAGIGSAGLRLSGKSNVTITGSGGSAGFRALAPTTQGAQGFGPVMFLIQMCSSCVVRDLVIEGGMVGVAPLGFDRCSNTVAQNITLSNVAYPANAAIVAVGNTGNSYLGNTVNTTTASSSDGTRGMWIGNTGDSQTEWNPTISNNTLNNIGATGIVGHSVGALINNNLVTNTKGAGIKVVPPLGKGGQNTIEGNTLRANLFHGVQVENADSPVVIRRNVIDNNAISGIYASGGKFTNAQIVENTITNHHEAGIYLYNGEGVTIQGNQLTGNGHGVTLEAIPGNTIQNVQITGNTMNNQSGNGVTMWGRGGAMQSIAVNTNSISNGMSYGVFVEQLSGTLTGISASGNCFANNASGTIYDNRSMLAPVASSASCSSQTTADTTAPKVAITAPTNGQSVSGTITLTATASDNVAVTGLQFQLNGAAFGPKLTAAPYMLAWDTRTVANGSYQVTAVAQDAAGNTATSLAVSAAVSNADITAPTVRILTPATGSAVSGTVTVTASASDNIGVAAVQYGLDGAPLGAEVTFSPYTYSWNTRGLSSGNHTLTATARDAAGNRSSASVTVSAAALRDTTLPTVTVTSPSNGQLISGTVTATASASDNVGVVGVQFLVDGAAYGGEISSAPYSVSWNSNLFANGSHSIGAVARDAAGNKSTSTVTVSVSNVAAPVQPTGSATSFLRINAGGPAYTDPSGKQWAADNGSNGGYVFTTGRTISGTTTPVLYQTQRWSDQPLGYQLNVPNGSYTLTLKFAELYFSAPQQRVFSVSVNGQTVLSNFDIVAQAGGAFRAVDRSFPVSVTGGKIVIQMASSIDDPAINAIELSTMAAPKSILRVNSGGQTVTDAAGNAWAADNGSAAGYSFGTNLGIANATTPALYQTLRWNSSTLGYQFTVANGAYTVNLKFAELYYGSAGQRVFNVAINGQTVLTNFDIVAQAGGPFRAVDRAFPVNVTNGIISIQFNSSVDDPQVNAIEIY
jgi:parallel beta-helix repeat protein